MKKVLIIYPHFPPSNLAGVHRPRLFAQHLPAFGWEPTILTVHEDYYEEALDYNLVRLLPPQLRIEKVKALEITRPRLVGDLGLRSLPFLYSKAKELIRNEGFDFLLIHVPSFYAALLGRWLHRATGIPYGIDYIDPWVHRFPGSEKTFSRHWWSTKLAAWLEPIAVKKASLITGVAPGYYEGVLRRNKELASKALSGAMPYGGEAEDLEVVSLSDDKSFVFKQSAKQRLVYAGAMLPKAFEPLQAMLKAVAANRELFSNVEFYFIGTGKTPDDPAGYSIKLLAEKYGLWEDVIFEHPARIPYFDVLAHLKAADGVFVLGSTEPHYTPSKVYQAFLSGKPLFAVLHKDSTAVSAVRTSHSGIVLSYDGMGELHRIEKEFPAQFGKFQKMMSTYDVRQADHSVFEAYSAKNATARLVALLNQIVTPKEKTSIR